MDYLTPKYAIVEPPDMLTPKEVAKCLRLTERALYRLRKAKEGPAWVRISRGRVLYPRREFEAWLERQKMGGDGVEA